MTETKDHGAPLALGEIRTHTVGDQTFQIMHTGGGAYTQATVRTAGVPHTTVLATLRFESVALRVYAGAIERAERAAAVSAPEVDNRAEIGAARTQRFHALFRMTRSWPAALDILHGEALIEARSILHHPAMVRAQEIGAAERQRAARVGALADVPQDRSADGVPEAEQANTPAEARTGTSDRVAAALNELAALRMLLGRTRMGGDRRDDLLEVLDGAVGLLKAEGGE